MKSTELMIGDIVMVNKDVCIKKGTIVRITAIDADIALNKRGLKGCARCVDIHDDSNSGGVWVDFLAPVSITKEIFEKMGWKHRKYGFYDCYDFLDDDYYEMTAYEFNDGMWNVEEECIEMGGIPKQSVNVCWVHELQHFFSQCGHEYNIDINND